MCQWVWSTVRLPSWSTVCTRVCSYLISYEPEWVQHLKWQYVRQFQILFLMLVSKSHQRYVNIVREKREIWLTSTIIQYPCTPRWRQGVAWPWLYTEFYGSIQKCHSSCKGSIGLFTCVHVVGTKLIVQASLHIYSKCGRDHTSTNYLCMFLGIRAHSTFTLSKFYL